MDHSFLIPSDIDKSIETTKNLLNLIPYIKKWWKGVFEKNKDKIIKPEDQENLKKILPQLGKESSKPKDQQHPIVREFLNKYDILLGNDDIYRIAPKNFINEEIIPILKSYKEKEANQSIDIVNFTEGEAYSNYEKEPKKIPEILSNLEITKFSHEFQSLLGLSSHVTFLMWNGKRDQANRIKWSIKERYGEEGLRFCNCYSIGYVTTYLKSIQGMDEKKIEEKLWQLAKMPLFFTSSLMAKDKIKEITNQITDSLNGKDSYIAIHSLGKASDFAKQITDEIIKLDLDKDYLDLRIDRKVQRSFSKEKIREYNYIWYNDKGKSFHDLFKSLWIS